MARRIDIELTSKRDDGTWTWRAPGARQPRGSLDGGLLPADAKVGDVVRAEADFDLEGIVVTSVQPAKGGTRTTREPRIEVTGSGRGEVAGGVSVVLAGGGRRRRDDDDHGGRPRRGTEERGRDGARTRTGRPPGRAEDRPSPRPAARGERPGRPERPERPERPGRGAPAPRAERGERPRRLPAVTTHRNAALAALRPEQLPVAEQLLRGGIPAVRQAIEEQNARARSEGRTEVSPEPLLTMAEELLPRVSLATWKDRAVAARAAGKDAPLREVRSIVSGASAVLLDEEGRELVGTLRDSLQARVTALREAWLGRIAGALDAGRVTEALRVSSRPPEPAARIPADVAVRLAEVASQAMAPGVSEADWAELLEAVVNSPVRRTVKPAGLPEHAGEDLLAAARRAAGIVPEVARLLGLPIPPPPGPRRSSATAGRRT